MKKKLKTFKDLFWFAAFLTILTNQTSFAQTEKVGIGTTSPSETLHVLGSGMIEDTNRAALTLKTLQNAKDVGLAFRKSGVNYSWNIFRSSNEALVFSNGNSSDLSSLTERLRITSNGRFGFGTDTPSAAYDLRNLSTSPILFRLADDANKELLHIDETGRVGIGRDPGAMLDIQTVVGASNSFRALAQDSTQLLVLKNSGKLGLNTDPGSTLDLKTAPGSSINFKSVSENDEDLFIIEDGGYVGIGTATPGAALDIRSSSPYVIIHAESDVGDNRLVLLNDGGLGINSSFPTSTLEVRSTTGEDINFRSYDDNGNELFQIKNNGRVGIGMSPGATLDVETVSGETDNFRSFDQNGSQIFKIQDDGDVFIPSGTLKITDNTKAAFTIQTTDNATPVGIAFANSGSSRSLNIKRISVDNGASGKAAMEFSEGVGNPDGFDPMMRLAEDSVSIFTNGNERLRIASNGDVMIGTDTPANGYKLSVKGKMMATGVRVQANGDWPDYVFADHYQKPTLQELKFFIDQNHHLPIFFPASQMESEGIDMETTLVQQQEWIEVSTLYILEQEDRIKRLEQKLEEQSQLIDKILQNK